MAHDDEELMVDEVIVYVEEMRQVSFQVSCVRTRREICLRHDVTSCNTLHVY